MESLYGRLTEYGQSDYYGFHMPGHKRNDKMMGNALPYKIDITEIEGFDDLHHAKGILKDAQLRAAQVYHAEETSYLINGSTAGILSAVLGCTRRGGRILMARNCHKSVYAAVYMNELEAEYIYPEYDVENGLNGALNVEKIRELLLADKEKRSGESDGYVSRIQAVVITSPTYDGVVSDVKRIAETAHEFGIPLVVDEAHGAHFGFHPYFPKNANQLGADVVIHSLHKTLPSMTQTALIHINGNIANRKRIRSYVHMLQTSSPSYVLMAGIDECIRFLEKQKSVKDEIVSVTTAEEQTENGKTAFDLYAERLERLREELKDLKMLRLAETEKYDKSKIVISTRGTIKRSDGTVYTGNMLSEELRVNYHLQMEMASQEYVLAMTSVCDTEDGFTRLKEALFEIDEKLTGQEKQPEIGGGQPGTVIDEKRTGETERTGEAVRTVSMALPCLERFCTSAQADVLAERPEGTVYVSLKESAGKAALEYAYVYPPGIPMIVPGERISKEAVDLLNRYKETGFDIEGLSRSKKIKVLTNV